MKGKSSRRTKEDFEDDEDEVKTSHGEITREASAEKAGDSGELTMIANIENIDNIDNYAAKDNTTTMTTKSLRRNKSESSLGRDKL
eukprot:5636430-Karenia_brevis.AAC.1